MKGIIKTWTVRMCRQYPELSFEEIESALWLVAYAAQKSWMKYAGCTREGWVWIQLKYRAQRTCQALVATQWEELSEHISDEPVCMEELIDLKRMAERHPAIATFLQDGNRCMSLAAKRGVSKQRAQVIFCNEVNAAKAFYGK